MQHYIIGYGTLIHPESRKRTALTGAGLPITLQGFKRGWFFRDSDRKRTVLGVVRDIEASCNAVLFTAETHSLALFDHRESGYKRIEINQQYISTTVNGSVWLYIIDKPFLPDTSHPIVQTYVDIVLSGCLGINEGFANEFITTTHGWQHPWVNNRSQRHPHQVVIDEFLNDRLSRQ